MKELFPVAVVTDSAAGIPQTLLQSLRIEVVPLWVQLAGESYQDGIDITPVAFFQRLRAQAQPDVGTSVPAMEVFTATYERISEWAQAVVSVHVAGKQSGTCNVASMAGQAVPIPVAVVDTGTTAMAQGFVVLEAARAALEGLSLAEVTERARAAVPNVGLTALLESISYAVRGGRLATAAGKLTQLLKIKPLISVRDNKVSIIGQTRRRSKGLKYLIEQLKSEIQDAPTRIAVHYAEDKEEGASVLAQIKQQLNCVEGYLSRVPVALGVHAGPGALGIAYHVERES